MSMISRDGSTVTLSVNSTLVQRYQSLREFIGHRVQAQARPAKTIAMEMDMAPSTLSRKLAPGDGDTQRFNCDDLERYMRATGDFSAIEYLAGKFLCSDLERRAKTMAKVEALARELDRTLASLREGSL